ncbi:CENPF protein, partial [Polioptila caerulea]|nr:CENPF protein [Polioptila caerulea]
MLQKQLAEHDELLKKENLTMAKHNKEDTDNAITEEIKLKLEELQESTEVKTREANENLEKYCSLIVKYHKLEEANEMLKTQVSLLSTQLKQRASDAVSTPLLNSEKSLTQNSKHSGKDRRSDEDTTKISSKRQRCEDSRKDNREPRSPAPETSLKKKRKCDISQNLRGQDNTDCELDGLPEVQKGFADIPSSKVSPYILHRTTLH